MVSPKGSSRSVRLAVALVVAAVAVALGTVPTLAADEPPPTETGAEAPLEPQEGYPDGPGDEQSAPAGSLASPEAQAERAASHSAYADASQDEAKALLASRFAPELSRLDSDPTRAIEPERIEGFLDDATARVDPAGPAPERVVVSSTPLRDQTESGAEAPVDQELDREGGAFEPRNPLTEVTLPADLSDPVRLPESGVAIGLASGTAADQAVPMGNDKLFYHQAAADTDLLIAPVTSGAELFAQLRSRQSPERLRFQVAMPQGAELREAGAEGVEVTQAGERIALISAPSATDAQGQDVPVALELVDGGVELVVEHRSMDLAYPALIDPVIADDYMWTFGAPGGGTLGMGEWTARTNYDVAGADRTIVTASQDGSWEYATPKYCFYSIACWNADPNASPEGRGLYIYARANRSYPSGTWSEWYYTAPGADTFISKAIFYPLYWRLGGGSANTPHLYYGIHNGTSAWVANTTPASPRYRTAAAGDQTTNYTSETFNVPSGTTSGRRVVFGVASNGNTLPQWRHGMLGGAQVTLDDASAPQVGATLGGLPSGWVSQGNVSLSAAATDAGLGLRSLKLKVPKIGAPGGIDVQGADSSCGGYEAGVCPPSLTQAASYDLADIPEGVQTITAEARDATDKLSSRTWEVRVDRSQPSLTLSGTLTQNAELGPELPHYRLHVDAEDTSGASPRSGIDDIFIAVDGQVVDSAEQTCGAGGCSLSRNWTLDSADYADGEHELSVTTQDGAGNLASQALQFDIAADHTNPQLSATGPMVDSGNALVGAYSDLAVNATDSGSGIASVSVLRDGEEIDEALQSCVDGACALDHEFALDLSEDEGGDHQFVVVATDAAGNSSELDRTIHLDPAPPSVELSGGLVERDGAPLNEPTSSVAISAADDVGETSSGLSKLEVAVDEQSVNTNEPDCSAGCPASAGIGYTYAKADWGPGSHRVFVTVTDGAGNETDRSLNVDVASTPPDATCPDDTPTEQTPTGMSGADAIAALSDAQPSVVAESEPTTDPSSGDALDPALQPRDPDEEPLDPDLEMTGTLIGGETSSSPAGGFTVGQVACLRPVHTTTAETDAAIVNDAAAVYANSAPDTDTVIRSAASGSTTVEVLRGADAPQTFSFAVGLEDDHVLEELANGAVAIVDPTEPAPDAPPVPPQPEGAQDIGQIANAGAQLAESDYELAKAEELSASAVAGVISRPWFVDTSGVVASGSINVVGSSTVQISLPSGASVALASSEDPGLLVMAASGHPDFKDCHSNDDPSPCGVFGRGHAVDYAVKWSAPDPPYERNRLHFPNFHADDCTNFISQVILAGGMEFMRERDKGKGSWWWHKTGYINEGGGVWYADGEWTHSWSLADVLPRHLYQYSLVKTVAHGVEHWAPGDIVVENWRNSGEVIDHIQYVVGMRDNGPKPAMPLIANHSTLTYRHMRWENVKDRIRAAGHGTLGDGWTYAILRPDHVRANTSVSARHHDWDALDELL